MSRKQTKRERIEAVINKHKKDITKKYQVKEIGVFGSYVRGEQGGASDVDILVEYDVVPDMFKFLELERYFEEILGMKVDLVRKEAIREELRDSILSEVVYV
ncbi:MAG: nucleotidyltransferase family protein [Candidatus Hydrothermarchaeales archaeon]